LEKLKKKIKVAAQADDYEDAIVWRKHLEQSQAEYDVKYKTEDLEEVSASATA